MAFIEDAFVSLRPYLYHTTSDNNLVGIIGARRLKSAGLLLLESDRYPELEIQRLAYHPIRTGHGHAWLQTQRPLHAGNIDFRDSYSLEDVVRMLNSRVFFWPGSEAGPIDYGTRHRDANKWPSAAAMLRMRTADVFRLAVSNPPQFCQYNSGSPRCSKGKKSPRGSKTFSTADSYAKSPGSVKEVVFDNHVDLPASTEKWDCTSRLWRPIFCNLEP